MSGHPDDEWASIEPSYADDYDALTRRRSRSAPAAAGRGPRRRRVGFLLLALVALVVGMGVGYARGYFAPGEEGPMVTVTIPEGATLTAIGTELEAQGVVKHARAFIIKAQSDGYSTRVHARDLPLPRQNEPYETLVAGLVKGVRPPSVKVTIPEGSTLRQTADLVAGKVPAITHETYVKVARDDPPPFELQGYKPGTTLEGMLFPATYEVDPKTKASAFVKDQLEAFDTNFAEVDMTRAHKANLTDYDVVIIASMIEREARVAAGAAAGRGRHLEPAQEGHAAADRRDHPVRAGRDQAGAHVRGPQDRLALQHLQERRPAADTHRQPRPGVAAGRRRPRRPPTTCTTWRATTAPAGTTSRPATTSSSSTRRRRQPPASSRAASDRGVAGPAAK